MEHLPEHSPAALFENEAGYRIDFDTNHNGQLLHHMPRDYLEKLSKRRYFVCVRPELKAALDLEGFTVTKPTRRRRALVESQELRSGNLLGDSDNLPTESEELERFPFTQATPTTQTSLDSTPTVTEQIMAPTVGISVAEPEYRLDFGKFAGKTLDEVSHDYLQALCNSWHLIWKRPSLRAALTQRGYSVAPYTKGQRGGLREGGAALPPDGNSLPIKEEESKESKRSSFFQATTSMSNDPAPAIFNAYSTQATLAMPASSHYLRPSAYSSRLAQVPAVSTSTSNNLTPAAFNISSTQQPPVVLSTSTDLFATSLTRVASKTHWTPPNIYNTPAKFRNRRTLDGGWLWISSWDARSIFRLTIDQFLRLPLADVPGIKKTQQVYWLYHVWDLVQFETSEANADEILTNMFANQINEQTQDVWGKKLLSKKDVSRRDTTLVDAGYGAGAHPALIPGEVDVDMG